MTTAITGPHQGIPVTTAREKFCAELFDTLWDRYRQRVAGLILVDTRAGRIEVKSIPGLLEPQ